MIWLVGCNGMLGTELSVQFDRDGMEWKGSGRDIDIRDLADAATRRGQASNIDWVVNCAAYTAVDKAEDEPALAKALNGNGAENLAVITQERGARIIHMSTDYVFDGTKASSYLENDPVTPLGVYGRTKAEGERRVREACARSIILRNGMALRKARCKLRAHHAQAPGRAAADWRCQ